MFCIDVSARTSQNNVAFCRLVHVFVFKVNGEVRDQVQLAAIYMLNYVFLTGRAGYSNTGASSRVEI